MPIKACEVHMLFGAFQGTNCITCFVKFWFLKLILLCKQNYFLLKTDSDRYLARFEGESIHVMAFSFFLDMRHIICPKIGSFNIGSFSVFIVTCIFLEMSKFQYVFSLKTLFCPSDSENWALQGKNYIETEKNSRKKHVTCLKTEKEQNFWGISMKNKNSITWMNSPSHAFLAFSR